MNFREKKVAKSSRLLISISFSSLVYYPLTFSNWEDAPQPILLASVIVVFEIGNSINDLELSDMLCSHQTSLRFGASERHM